MGVKRVNRSGLIFVFMFLALVAGVVMLNDNGNDHNAPDATPTSSRNSGTSTEK